MYTVTEQVSDQAALREFQKIAATINSNIVGRILVLHVAPPKPADGQVVICDGVNWNPLGDGIKRPIWFNKDTGLWTSFS